MKHPGLLYQMVGARTSTGDASNCGHFGEKSSTIFRRHYRCGLAHVFASDAHHLPGRSYEMSAAFKRFDS